MNGIYNQSQFSDSLKNFNLNQVGLEEAEHNYFIKYAHSGYSQSNQQKLMKKLPGKINILQTVPINKLKSTQNQVLRELKQQYEILKNLPFDNKVEFNSKPKRVTESESSSLYDQGSDVTSSKKSKHKEYSREAQILALQKKQLEVVISNSMRKIQELLTNQMQNKKTIHELKLQIQGKGGINSQFQLTIRNYKKKQKQLNENIYNLKLQIQKNYQYLKNLQQKVAFLEGDKSRKDEIQRNYFEEQRQMDIIIKNEKDKSMNAEMQLRKSQMEFEIMQKDKNSQINRLMKQLQMKDNQPENYLEIIKQLKQQLQTKQQKNQLLIEKIQKLNIQNLNRPLSPVPDTNKKILEELVKQMKTKNQSTSKDNNEVLIKVLIQKFGSQRESVLKNQLSSLKLQVDNIRRNSSVSEYPIFNSQDPELKSRLRQLERVVDEEKKQKKQLYEDIERLRIERDEIERERELHKRKVRQYKQTEEELLNEIKELSLYKVQLDQSNANKSRIQEKVNKIRANYDLQQSLVEREFYGNQSIESYQDQIRILRRKIDELTFALQKATQERVETQTLARQQKQGQMSGIMTDLNRYKSLVRDKQSQVIITTQDLKREINSKNQSIRELNRQLIDLQQIHQSKLQQSKLKFEQLLKIEAEKTHLQMQSMNQKIISLNQTVGNFNSKNQYYTNLQREAIELRRVNKNTKRMTEAVGHLWEIKQAEYGNINEIFNIIKVVPA